MHTIRNLRRCPSTHPPRGLHDLFSQKTRARRKQLASPSSLLRAGKKKTKKKRPSEAQLQRFRLRRAVPLNRAFPEKRLGFSGTTARSHVRLSEYGMFMFQFGGNAALSLVIDTLMVTSASVFSKSSARVAVNA